MKRQDLQTPVVPPGTFGEALRYFRTMAERTLNECAAELKVSASYISAIERGERRPPGDTVCEKLFSFLGFEYSEELRKAAYFARSGGDYLKMLGLIELLIRGGNKLRSGMKINSIPGVEWDQLVKKVSTELKRIQK
jgi:transcriptional regulator with XRE-family HTH domain